jgi:drug/metabolite transporter (DMT)-like permease
MGAILSPRAGLAVILAIAVSFGSNHVAARYAIDHGASVAFAVTVRSACTALFLLGLLRLGGVSLELTRSAALRALAVGVVVAVQSFCLYSAVARIPVALALLVFQTSPILFVLLSWIAGKEVPSRHALLAMPLALAGLALALDAPGVAAAGSGAWADMVAGVAYAFSGAIAFTVMLYCNAHWLKALDGRVRTFLMMSVTAVLVGVVGAAAGALDVPRDAAGWGGVALLTVFYGGAITSLFVVLPRLGGGAASTVALNFEPIAALVLGWMVLGQTVKPLQIVGAFLVVGAIAWMGARR